MSDDSKPTFKLKTATPLITSKTEITATAPFPVGARLRYIGTERLFANYQMISVLEPGAEVDVVELAGAYSIYTVNVLGHRYSFLIGEHNRAEWQPVAVS